MFRNYVKTTIRTLVRQRGHLVIIMAGLILGLTCTTLLALTLLAETGYDSFHENKDTTYRLMSNSKWWSSFWGSPAPLAPALVAEVPGVIRATRLAERPTVVFTVADDSFFESGGFLADPDFFDIFSFPFVYGDPATAFPSPHCIVITERLGRKYFGDDNPLGRIINVDGIPTTVTGVLENIPDKSHLRFDFIASFDYLRDLTDFGNSWSSLNFATYVQVDNSIDAPALGPKITELAATHGCNQVTSGEAQFYLQPLTDIHLGGSGMYSYGEEIDAGALRNLGLLALFILAISCINFMNLATARSTGRAKEVGMRKVIGSSRRQLAARFLGESLMVTAASGVLSLLLVELVLPFYNRLIDKSLVLKIGDPAFMTAFIGILVVTGLVAGSYPAFYLSSFHPLKVLRGAYQDGRRGIWLRRILVIGQFAIAIGLTVGTLLVYQQLNFMTTHDLGFDAANIAYVPVKGTIGSQYQGIKNALLAEPGIEAVSAKNYLGAGIMDQSGVSWERQDPEHHASMVVSTVGFDYLEMLNFTMIEGRAFSPAYMTDIETAFVVNEAAARTAGLDSPIGTALAVGDKNGTIVGVIADANFRSLQHEILPLVLDVRADISGWDDYGVVLIKFDPTRRQQAMAAINTVWNRANPDIPLELRFLEDTYAELYAPERRLQNILQIFALLAIVVSCLGTVGLSIYLTERRTKEIGIRKVLGAPAGNLVRLVSREYMVLVLAANIVAWPIAYYFAGHWLETFAYRITIGWTVFILAGFVALVLAVVSVAYQSVRVAVNDPVKALRHE